MGDYSLQDIERLLGLPRAVVQGFIDAEFVVPTRGPHNTLRFSFQDLVLLRAAQGLSAAHVPRSRIKKSLLALKKELPGAMPLAGMRIGAVGSRVVVKKGESQWQPDSGQYLFDFEVAPAPGNEVTFLKPNATKPSEPAGERAHDWFERGSALEAEDPSAAIAAYRKALELDPKQLGAAVNLGCMLQASKRPAEAARIYRDSMKHHPDESLLHFNLGIAYEDLKHVDAALVAYERALMLDAELADAHFTLARLYEARGKKQEAIRHLAEYKRLATT